VVGDAHRHALRLDALGDRQLLGRVEDREVDVAGIVELEGPVLAHGDAEQARAGPSGPLADMGQRPARHLQPHGLGQGGVQGRVGEAGQGAGHRVQVPDPAQVAQGGQQVQVGLQLAHRRRAVSKSGSAPTASAAARIRPGAPSGSPSRIDGSRLAVAPRQAGQVGRGGKHRRQGGPGGLDQGAASPTRRVIVSCARSAALGSTDGAAGGEAFEQASHGGNPMIALASRLVRIDQELACDATVVALRGDIRADYAKALMKAQMGVSVSPLACGWATHPLILRVSLLNHREPGLARDVTGFLSITFLAVAAMAIVWSVAPRGPDFRDLKPGLAAQINPYTGAIVWVKVDN
jgi:hypothetical protein